MDKKVNIAIIVKLIKLIVFNRGENESQKKNVPCASLLEKMSSFLRKLTFGTCPLVLIFPDSSIKVGFWSRFDIASSQIISNRNNTYAFIFNSEMKSSQQPNKL